MGNTVKFNIPKDELIYLLYFNSVKDIAYEYDVSIGTVYLKKHAYNITKEDCRKEAEMKITKDELIKELTYATINEVAFKYKVMCETLIRKLKEYDITLEEISQYFEHDELTPK